jgi:hypothetical protein
MQIPHILLSVCRAKSIETPIRFDWESQSKPGGSEPIQNFLHELAFDVAQAVCRILGAAGNDAPPSLPRLLQGGADQIRGDSFSTKFSRHKGVLEGYAIAIERVAEERQRMVANTNFKASRNYIVRYSSKAFGLRRQSRRAGAGVLFVGIHLRRVA